MPVVGVAEGDELRQRPVRKRRQFGVDDDGIQAYSITGGTTISFNTIRDVANDGANSDSGDGIQVNFTGQYAVDGGMTVTGAIGAGDVVVVNNDITNVQNVGTPNENGADDFQTAGDGIRLHQISGDATVSNNTIDPIGDDGIPRIHADGRLLRLWERSIGELGLGERRGDPMRSRLRKFYVEPVAASHAAVPVRAIYSLIEIRGRDEPGIDRQNIVDATKSLAANAYRPMLVRRLGQQDVYFRGGATIAAAAGIYRLKRMLGFDHVAATIEMLEAHWSSIGLTGGPS